MERTLVAMASNLIRRARDFMVSQKAKAIRVSRERKHETAMVAGEAAGVAVTIAAAVSDQKLGKGQQFKAGPVPVNAIGGVVLLAPAFFLGKSPIAQAVSVNAGMSGLKAALYRYLTDTIEPGQ